VYSRGDPYSLLTRRADLSPASSNTFQVQEYQLRPELKPKCLAQTQVPSSSPSAKSKCQARAQVPSSSPRAQIPFKSKNTSSGPSSSPSAELKPKCRTQTQVPSSSPSAELKPKCQTQAQVPSPARAQVPSSFATALPDLHFCILGDPGRLMTRSLAMLNHSASHPKSMRQDWHKSG
jgi:hypothetical protein